MTAALKDQYREDAFGSGRYSRYAHSYDDFPDITWDNVGEYANSDDVMDRVAVYVWLNQETLRLPAVWVVIEDPETSPNLVARHPQPVTPEDVESQVRSAWSAHVDKEDADAWCAMFQQKSDRQIEMHPWWGKSSRRIFKVVLAAGAPVGQLRQPGATPYTPAFE